MAGAHQLARACGRAIAAEREQRSPSEAIAKAATLPIDGLADIHRIRSFLPAPWLGEMATLLEAARRTDLAAALLDGAPEDARRHLLRMARSTHKAISGAASRLLKTVARAPAETVSIDVLGPLRIRFDGVERWPAELNRRVVRDLLLLLVDNERLTREQIVALEWPDADDAAGKASLRTALSYLNKALEPRRGEGEVPFFVTEQGEQICLARGPHLRIDSDRFEELLRSATRSEAQGAPSAALEYWLEAAELFRGDYAVDAGSAEWVLASRDRIRVQFVNAAVRAGALLVARGHADRAVALATRAIAVEPWSESARTLVGEAYLQLGDVAAARRAVEQCDAMLAELGVRETDTLSMLRRRLTS